MKEWTKRQWKIKKDVRYKPAKKGKSKQTLRKKMYSKGSDDLVKENVTYKKKARFLSWIKIFISVKNRWMRRTCKPSNTTIQTNREKVFLNRTWIKPISVRIYSGRTSTWRLFPMSSKAQVFVYKQRKHIWE
jgi:hypothetical protein